MGTYLHVLEGRIRIKVPPIKRSPTNAADVERRVRALDPSIDVKANPTTGNVLLLFNPASISQDRILGLFADIGSLTNQIHDSHRPNAASNLVASSPDASSIVARRIVEVVLQIAIERIIFALV